MSYLLPEHEIDRIAAVTHLPKAQVVGIYARQIQRTQRRMHAFCAAPFTDDCIDCDGREDEPQHYTAEDQADRAINQAEDEG